MKKNKHVADLELLTQELTRMREDFAALATTVKEHINAKTEATFNDEHQDAQGEGGHLGWSDVQKAFEETKIRSEKMLKDLASEVERHPIRSVVAAMGIGFILAKIFGRGRNS